MIKRNFRKVWKDRLAGIAQNRLIPGIYSTLVPSSRGRGNCNKETSGVDMDIKDKARLLRKNSTDAEKRLWGWLRNRGLNGWKFRRQFPIGQYIVDFECHELKLIVEADGGQHAKRQLYDIRRTEYLQSKGYQIVRFWNNEVLGNLEGVLEALTLSLSQRERDLLLLLPPGEGRDEGKNNA